MSHCIEQPIDRVLSTTSTEWHGLAEIEEVINSDVLEQRGLFFPITKSQVINWKGENQMADELSAISAMVKNADNINSDVLQSALDSFRSNLVFVDTHQTVLADLTACRPDLVASGHATVIPLHIPKSSYHIIDNRRVFETIERAFPECPIVTAGTLKGGKVFFASMDIGQRDYIGPRGDIFKQYLDAISSHDGTLGTRYYDSGTRIVCMNTLQMSLNNMGEFSSTVYHTAGAEKALDTVSVNIQQILSGRTEYFDSLGYLDTVSITPERAKALFAHFITSFDFDDVTDRPESLSTQAFNRTEEIAELFRNGTGNRGANLYDLFNAVTECFTWGSGTGAKCDKQEKFIKSRDGRPAQVKEGFYNFLLSGPDELEAAFERGNKLFKEKETATNEKKASK